jgi:hypothetical protein
MSMPIKLYILVANFSYPAFYNIVSGIQLLLYLTDRKTRVIFHLICCHHCTSLKEQMFELIWKVTDMNIYAGCITTEYTKYTRQTLS